MKHSFLLAILSTFLIFSCKVTEPTVTKSTQKDVTTLALSGIANATSVFDQATNTYTFTVPIGTNVKSLALTFSIPTGAKSSPASGSTQDFTNPVTYTITAEDGTSTKYTVKINVQTASKSSAKQILTFSFGELNPVVQATINNATFEATAEIPATANIKSLKPTITVSDKATISPLSGVSQDFTNPVKYIVTAEDGTTQVFMVKAAVQVIPPVSNVGDVFVAGYVQKTSAAKFIATYWKNGTEINLTTDKNTYSYATSIFVNGNDVYVAGYEAVSNFVLNTIATAKYWKNGIPVNLTNDEGNAYANAIVVKGNDVYVAGSIDHRATYWKNGIEVRLDLDPIRLSDVKSMVVNGNDIYMAGYIDFKATYWKNGVSVILDNSKGQSSIGESIVIDGKDIYVAGTQEKFNLTSSNALYWKNGVATNLTNGSAGSRGSHALSIAVDGTDVYVVGESEGYSGYWSNGKDSRIDGNPILRSIVVSRRSRNLINIVGTASSNTAVYINETLYASPLSKDTYNSFATSIFVK